jgi:hypothetical protein
MGGGSDGDGGEALTGDYVPKSMATRDDSYPGCRSLIQLPSVGKE